MHRIKLFQCKASDFSQSFSSPDYHILLFKGEGDFSVDFTTYRCNGATVLFFTPFQTLVWGSGDQIEIEGLAFHGDFYCIEYHKHDVACNGLLFNNIYMYPHITVSDTDFDELHFLLGKIRRELTCDSSFSDAILKAYLQLILALCSRTKKQQLHEVEAAAIDWTREMNDIRQLIDTHFLTQRSPSFYASELALSPSALSKKTRQFFGKTPTQLIQDRVVLEAKKMLHLTRIPIKEIATQLNFEDVFYFSRYFRKTVGLSPLHYRQEVGISIVAK
ncbi:AraC family transcriptional regulator [Tannerella sp.]|uniref:helix-turn-helix domain-containing protein n=1 Tax=Tannerella sp. TaxID=2382127 RepID=UPI0026DD1D86|nr:AraC family transcriptional regulator [Tannerella sp.]MDO4702852.1 AraC family transcriptional regulator [Tannerella sp.]